MYFVGLYARQKRCSVSIITLNFKENDGNYCYWFAVWASAMVNNVPNSKVHGANMGPPGSCWPQMGPMLAPWTLLSGVLSQQLAFVASLYVAYE